MADNVPIPGTGTGTAATDKVTHSGDTADVQLVRPVAVTGAEGAKTVIDLAMGAGAVSTGTPRTTLASDDPAVAALAAIKTAIEILDNIVGGSEAQVDIVGSLPAGTNAIGKLAANSGVDIGDVDVTSVPADPFGANADAAVAAGAVGSIQAKLRRLTSDLDAVKTAIVSLDANVAASQTETLLTAIQTAVQLIDNAISGTEMQVDVVAALPAGTNNIGDVDVLTVPADPFGANADAAATAGSTGSIQAKLRLMTSQLDAIKTAVETLDNAISGSEMQVDVVGSLPAGSATIGEVGWAEQLDRNNDEVRIATTEEANPSTFRALISDAEGRLITRPWGGDVFAQGHAPASNTQATTTKAAGGAGVRHICTGITATFVATNAAPSAASVAVFLRDGASGAGTVRWAAVMSMRAEAGHACPPICLTGLNIRGTADTAMCLEFSVAGGPNTLEVVSLQGVTVTEA